MNNWLSVQHLNKTIWGKIILNDVSFDIDKWTSVWFIWNNWAWKTTTIKMLAGINEPDSWTILFDGKDVFKMRNENTVWYLPEKTYFPTYLTWVEFIKVMCELNEITFDQDFVNALFEELGLLEASTEKIKGYSKWMMQRLWFVSLLINPKIEYLFLDEPMSGLDHVGQIETIEIIKKLKARGLTVMTTSHHMNEIEEICDEIIFIKKWQIIDRRSVLSILKEFWTLKDYYLSMSK